MATKDLKVDELRAQLAQRGLSTAGIKPTLVRRLEAALRDDSKKPMESKSNSNNSLKRQRESDGKDVDSEMPLKIKAVDELRSLNVKQLREEASVRGVSAVGTRKELLERLCAGGDNHSSDIGQAKDDSNEDNVDSHVVEKVKDIDDLQTMNIKQLREEASVRGVSAAGTKKELLERLCAGGDNDSSDSEQMEDDSKDASNNENVDSKDESNNENVDSHITQKVKDELLAMNIKQLREEASVRGLSAAGTKKELLERLCAGGDNDSSDSGQMEEDSKDERNNENVDSHVTQKVKDELFAMNIKQLREEASARGVSATGTKKELLERLCAGGDNDSSDSEQMEDESNKENVDSKDENNNENVDSHTTQKVKDELLAMNIKQLREEASVRGVSAAGTKKELLERLCAGGDNDSSDSGQMEDDSKDESNNENVDSHVTQKVKDELLAMNIKQLREEASVRGVSAAGTKKELLERLCAGGDNDSSHSGQMEDDSKDENNENVDSHITQKVKDELLAMNIKQLREEASVRGVSAAGTKKELIERLCTRSDNNLSDSGQVKDYSNEENADSHVTHKVRDIDELQAMNIKQLREEASVRGASSAGTKKELLERLCAGGDNDTKSNGQAAKEDSKVKNDDSHATQKVSDIDDLQVMTTKQLRDEAVTRGISVAGTKKELLKRLCANNDDVSNDNVPVKGNSKDEKQKVEIDDMRAMNVKQLREEAIKHGISAVGTKKELLERLCAAADDISNDDDPVKEEKEEKIVTATKKGSAVLDKCLPDHIKAQYHVLQVGDEIYDAMLNQTNVGQNNNKFFVIQILESDDGGKYMVYFRWGRVGVKGQDKLNGPYNSQEASISMFEKKFSDKTKNHWCNRKYFDTQPRCYTWLEMDYSETKNEQTAQQKLESTSRLEPKESKLEARIAKFISLICNMSMMRQQMMEIGYNAEKLPLGKLSKSTILKGYGVLKRLADVIGHADRKTLEQLSGEFYTVIPHDFGFKKTSLFIIDTPGKLKSKLEMVEALAEIEVAMKLIENDTDMEDPLYSQYKRLQCDLVPLEVYSDEFSMIQKYTKNTHAKTHSNYDVDIIQIFKVSRECEAERFKKFSETKNRMLLWHGSRLTNWTGILSQGLRIAPPEAPVTGYMFGKGVYFADMFSKSANYCCSSTTATSGVLLLCEVALGDMAELQAANYEADKLPVGKLSTKGVGGTAPDLSESLTLEDGVVVPLGKPKEQPGPKGSLFYNEYIVYNVEQIRMRYVVHVNFNYKG